MTTETIFDIITRFLYNIIFYNQLHHDENATFIHTVLGT